MVNRVTVDSSVIISSLLPQKSAVISEKHYWLQAAGQSVQKVWDNEDDDVYNELLQRRCARLADQVFC